MTTIVDSARWSARLVPAAPVRAQLAGPKVPTTAPAGVVGSRHIGVLLPAFPG